MAQRKYEDYVQRLYDEFPSIEKSSIDNIIVHGLKRIAYFVRLSQDIMLENKIKDFFIYIGRTDKKEQNALQYIRSQFNQHKKLRRLYKELKKDFDGYYYFGLTEEENNLETLDKVIMYKIKEECSIRKNVEYIYKMFFPIEEQRVWYIIKYNFKKDKAELISHEKSRTK